MRGDPAFFPLSNYFNKEDRDEAMAEIAAAQAEGPRANLSRPSNSTKTRRIEMKNVIIITVDWSSMASIKKAERAKLKAENAGYKLVNTVSTPMSAKLKYVKQ